MYVANTTRQNYDFRYRVPEARRERRQEIAAGGQIAVSEELTREAIESIVEQHEIYGMVDATKIAQRREHITLLYAVGQPVTRNQMLQALERNLAVMDQRGVEQRSAAALTATSAMEYATPGNAFEGLEMFIEEQKGVDGATPSLHEQHVVDRNGTMRYENRQGGAPPPTPRRGRRKAA